MNKPIPYPADVRAKGWRFEIDMEKIKGSDTWLRARTGSMRGMLLLLWSEAWMQTPCGSLPDDDELIALMLDMDDTEFAQRRAVLMRGWSRADDGRLYHQTITERVLSMMAKRRSDADRQASRRASRLDSAPGPRDKAGVTRDKADVTCDTDRRSHESNTGTGTGTGTSSQVVTPTPETCAVSEGVEGQSPTKAGAICRALKAKGVIDVNPSNPELTALIAKGVPLEVFEAAAETTIKAKPRRPLPYLLSVVKGQLASAAAIASGVGMPQNPWDENRTTIEAKGVELGLGKWNEADLSVNRETFPAYTARVRRAVESSMQLA